MRGRVKRGWPCNGYRVLDLQDDRVLEIYFTTMWMSLTVFNSTLKNGQDEKKKKKVKMVNFMLCVFTPNKVSICKSKHIHWLRLSILSIVPTGRHKWPVVWNEIPEKRHTVVCLHFWWAYLCLSAHISFTAPFSTKESRLEFPWMGAENQNKDGGGEGWRHRGEGSGTGPKRSALGHGASHTSVH